MPAQPPESTAHPGNLHEALAQGDIPRALGMVEAGARLDAPSANVHGFSASQWACGFHGPSMLDRLHGLGWLPTQDPDWIKSAARCAISRDNACALEWLVKKGLEPNAPMVPMLDWSALGLATHRLSVKCMDVLLAAGARADFLDKMGQGLIHILASTPQQGTPTGLLRHVLEKCLGLGLDINLRDSMSGDTPVSLAAFNHNLPAIRLLAAHGADIHTVNSSGYGLVHAACQGDPGRRSYKVLAYLLGQRVDPNMPRVTHPVHFAAARNNAHALRALARTGVDLEVPLCDDQAQTPVYTAMCSASTEAVKFLLSAGVRCSISDRRGCGLLHLACGRKRIELPGMREIMHDLVRARRLDPDMSSHSRQTPLLHAAQEGSVLAMQTMLDLGASATAVCLEARNLLHYVAQQPSPAPALLAISVVPTVYRCQPDVRGYLPHELAYSLGHGDVGAILQAAWSSSGLSTDTAPVSSPANPQQRI